MLICKRSNFFRVVLVTFLFLEGCTSLSRVSNEDSQKKAFEIAQTECGRLLHSIEIESPNNVKAVLTTFAEARRMMGYDFDDSSLSAKSKVWLVELTGRWQLTGGPPPAVETPIASDSPVPTPELWNVCEVMIDPNNDWRVLYVHQAWNDAVP